MDQEEVITLAKQVAKEKRWIWIDPVEIKKKRRFFIGKLYWRILTNNKSKGNNIYIEIDDSTKAVVRSAFWKR